MRFEGKEKKLLVERKPTWNKLTFFGKKKRLLSSRASILLLFLTRPAPSPRRLSFLSRLSCEPNAYSSTLSQPQVRFEGKERLEKGSL